MLYRLITELMDSYLKDNLRNNSLLEAAISEASKSVTRGTQNRTVHLNIQLQDQSVDNF